MERPERFSKLQRYGKIGFLFFFLKGLLWLIIPALIAAFFGAD
jgi:hypothetical protein